eukprot:1586843-Prymnesium_polylepis.1
MGQRHAQRAPRRPPAAVLQLVRIGTRNTRATRTTNRVRRSCGQIRLPPVQLPWRRTGCQRANNQHTHNTTTSSSSNVVCVSCKCACPKPRSTAAGEEGLSPHGGVVSSKRK